MCQHFSVCSTFFDTVTHFYSFQKFKHNWVTTVTKMFPTWVQRSRSFMITQQQVCREAGFCEHTLKLRACFTQFHTEAAASTQTRWERFISYRSSRLRQINSCMRIKSKAVMTKTGSVSVRHHSTSDFHLQITFKEKPTVYHLISDGTAFIS